MKWIVVLTVALMAGINPVMADERPVRLHCASDDGITRADIRMKNGRYLSKLSGESKWSRVPADFVGPLVLMLWADGAKCVRR